MHEAANSRCTARALYALMVSEKTHTFEAAQPGTDVTIECADGARLEFYSGILAEGSSAVLAAAVDRDPPYEVKVAHTAETVRDYLNLTLRQPGVRARWYTGELQQEPAAAARRITALSKWCFQYDDPQIGGLCAALHVSFNVPPTPEAYEAYRGVNGDAEALAAHWSARLSAGEKLDGELAPEFAYACAAACLQTWLGGYVAGLHQNTTGNIDTKVARTVLAVLIPHINAKQLITEQRKRLTCQAALALHGSTQLTGIYFDWRRTNLLALEVHLAILEIITADAKDRYNIPRSRLEFCKMYGVE